MRAAREDVADLPLELFTGVSDQVRMTRRNLISGMILNAAAGVAYGNGGGAIHQLQLARSWIDGIEPPPDWMVDSAEKAELLAEIDRLIGFVELL